MDSIFYSAIHEIGSFVFNSCHQIRQDVIRLDSRYPVVAAVILIRWQVTICSATSVQQIPFTVNNVLHKQMCHDTLPVSLQEPVCQEVFTDIVTRQSRTRFFDLGVISCSNWFYLNFFYR